MMTAKYPIDFENLKKGTDISVDELEQIVGVRRTHPNYVFRVQRIRSEIEHFLNTQAEGSLRGAYCKHEGQGLRILLDSEAVPYLAARREKGRRTIMKAAAHLAAVDRSKLTEAEQRTHDLEMHRSATYQQALTDARQRIRRLTEG